MTQPAAATERDERRADRPGGLLEVDAAVAEDISALLDAGQRGMVLNLTRDLYPADLALLLTHLPFEEARQLFAWLPADQASEALTELDDEFRAALLEGQRAQRLANLLDDLDTDDAADLLADLPNEVVRRVLPRLEDAEDLADLLGYDEESAGGLMAREYVAVAPDLALADAVEAVREHARDIDEIYAIFVVDEEERLKGIVSLKHLVLSPAATPIREVMDADFISVTTGVDQEEVARIMERYDLVSLPVLDREGRLVGRITIDDVVDVIRREAEEDMQIMSGVSGDETPTASVWRISRGRLPWLLIGLVGAGASGLVIGSFEGALERAVVLAAFIPVVMAMAGNAGIQSAAIAVQGLASGDVWTSDMAWRLGKELVVALINGVVLAGVLALFVFLVPMESTSAGRLAVTAGLSLLIVIILSTCIGTTVPLLLDRLGIDPALATGPFITTSNDIIGLAVFFLIATLIYL